MKPQEIGTIVRISGTPPRTVKRSPTVRMTVGHGTPNVGAAGYRCPNATVKKG